MKPRIFFFQILPHLAAFLIWLVAAIGLDALFHLYNLAELGRYLGPLGVILLALSFIYTARKRKWFQQGSLKFWLKVHEALAWAGSLAIMVHSGIHFNALLPWLASLAMILAVASGVTGAYLLKSAQGFIKEKQAELKERGYEPEAVKRDLFADALMVGAMKRWRIIHKPITLAVGLLALAHVFFVVWYGGLL